MEDVSVSTRLAGGTPFRLLRGRSLGIAALLAAYLCLAGWFTLAGAAKSLPAALVKSDFRAYYCAARVAAAGRDPYLAAPLGACEAEVGAAAGLSFDPRFPDPAPLPGYVIAAFMPLASLPYLFAAALWWALILSAIGLSVVLLARLTGLPLAVAGAMIYGTELVDAILFGQLAPLVTLGLLSSAALLRRGRDGAAGFALGLTLLQPQVGLPVVLAAFLWKAGTRRSLAVTALLLGCIWLRTTGWHGAQEFADVVLPAQALGQVPLNIQYGLAWILHVGGLSDAAAVRVASLQYAVTALAAALLARRVAGRLQADDAVLFFPAAASVLGGSYIHAFQFCVALPFAALLLARAEGRLRPAAAVAAVLLALPSALIWTSGRMFVAALAAWPIAQYADAQRPAGWRRGAGILAVTAVLVLPGLLSAIPGTTLPAGPLSNVTALYPEAFASVRHAERIRELPEASHASWRLVAEKSAKWIPLLALVGLGFGAALPRRRKTAAGERRLRYIL